MGFVASNIIDYVSLVKFSLFCSFLYIVSESEKLLLIRQRTYIGSLPGGHDVYGINKIIVLPISMKETPELGIEVRFH